MYDICPGFPSNKKTEENAVEETVDSPPDNGPVVPVLEKKPVVTAQKRIPVPSNIVGTEAQALVIDLKPGQHLNAAKGAFCFGDEGIGISVSMSDGSQETKSFFGKLSSSVSRKLSGESFFLQKISNTVQVPQRVCLASSKMGEVYKCTIKPGCSITVTSGAMLAVTPGVHINFKVMRSVSSGLFGGEGLVMQTLSGKGTAFITAGGSIIEHTLKDSGINVDTGSLLGYTGDIVFKAKPSGSLSTMLFAGEGLFLSSLRGSGIVLVESYSKEKQVSAIYSEIEPTIKKSIKRATK